MNSGKENVQCDRAGLRRLAAACGKESVIFRCLNELEHIFSFQHWCWILCPVAKLQRESDTGWERQRGLSQTLIWISCTSVHPVWTRNTDRNYSSTQVQGKCLHGAALSFPPNSTKHNGRREFYVYELSWWGYTYPLDVSLPIEGSGINPQASAPSAERKKLPFMATDHRLKPLATKPTNEALSVVAGQQRKRSREIWPSSHPCMNLPSASFSSSLPCALITPP